MNEKGSLPMSVTTNANPETLSAMTIRDLVDRWPTTMEVLTPLGIDLCCGGAHPLGEALDLHGFDRAEVLPKVVAVVAAAEGER